MHSVIINEAQLAAGRGVWFPGTEWNLVKLGPGGKAGVYLACEVKRPLRLDYCLLGALAIR